MDVIPNKRIINAWTTYDLANSVYNLVITATIFPIYYKSISPEKISVGFAEIKNTSLYDFSIAIAYLIIAALAPLLSGIADFGGNKKKFMQFFCYLGSSACMLMFFFTSNSIIYGLLLAIFACIGFSGSLVFYNAYLPEIAPPNLQDKVSARGFAKGYWGSSILLILNLILIQKPEWFGLLKEDGSPDQGFATRISFLLVGLWWLGFAQIPFYYLPNGKAKTNEPNKNILKKGYSEIIKVWKELGHQPKLKRFLIAFFTYSMGVQTIMLVATLFGSTEIKDENGIPMDSGKLIITILIIQFVAMIGAHLFSFVSSKKGNIFTLKLATLIWGAICIGTYLFVYTPTHFYLIAAMVGLLMGGIQALSRSTYSKMLPETNDHASYFSFYDVTEKLSIVCGMIMFGLLTEVYSSMRTPIISLITLFITGFILLGRVDKLKTH